MRTKSEKELMGEFLAEARRAHGSSQLEVTREMGWTSPQYVSNIERGICGPPMDRLKDYAKAVGIKPIALASRILQSRKKAIYKSAGL